MKLKEYAKPGSTWAFVLGNESAHHWTLEVEADEYNALLTSLKNTKWNKTPKWYPIFVPSAVLTGTTLEVHIVAYDDRDATYIRMLL